VIILSSSSLHPKEVIKIEKYEKCKTKKRKEGGMRTRNKKRQVKK
jgi:hypothetical protein